MTSKRCESEADIEISDFITQSGIPTTPRKVRTWRQVGLIPKTEVVRYGYAKAVRAFNTPETFERAEIVAKSYRGQRAHLNRVVLRLFAQDHEVPIELLREALVGEVKWLLRFLDTPTGETDLEERIDNASISLGKAAHRTRTGRFILKRAGKASEESNIEIVTTAMQLMLSALFEGDIQSFTTHGAGSADALDEFLEITGAIGLATDSVPGVGAIVTGGIEELRSDFVQSFEASSAENMIRLARESSMEMFVWARHEAIRMFRFISQVASNIKLRNGPKNAFGVAFGEVLDVDEDSVGIICLIFLVQADDKGVEAVKEGILQLEETMLKQDALFRYLQAFPAPQHKYLFEGSEDKLAEASKELRDDVTRRFSIFVNENPGAIEILNAKKPVGD